MSVVEQLIEMGFDAKKAKAAEEAAGTLEGAIEWIMNNDSGPAPSAESSENPTNGDETGAAQSAAAELVEIAASYKCNDCGKLFRNEDEIMFHATKTKHENFSESSEKIAELTPEQRAAKVAELRDKIKLNQAKRAKIEEEENREKERKRREDGKAAIARKEEMQDRELREAAAQRRREKQEDEIAKKRVLEQIKADREARKAQASGVQVVQKPVAPVAPIQQAPPKDYDSTTIQFRLLNGQTVKQNFKANEPLAMVRAWIDTNHSENGVAFAMMTPFPRRVFSDDDMGTPLSQLELVPSANIVLTRR